jgi:hypothetical protein
MEPVDPPHDSLRPLDGTGDERFGSRAGTRIVQIFGILEVPSDEYAGSIAKTRLRPFSICSSVTDSLFVRHRKAANS